VNLYELTEEAKELRYLLEESGGELTPEIEAALNIHDATAADKLAGYGAIRAAWLAEVEGIKAEEARLAYRRKGLRKGVAKLEARAHEYLTASDKTEIKAGTFVFKTAKCAPALGDIDEAKVPGEYWVVPDAPPRIDRKALLEAAKANPIPGVEVVQRTRLVIK